MREFFEKMAQLIKNGTDTVLAVIVEKQGSAPRDAGAMMLVTAAGRAAGTVGGGAIEFESINTALEVLKERGNRRRTFTLRHSEAADIGMVCGGSADIFFKYIEGGDDTSARMAEKAAELVRKGIGCRLVLDTGGDYFCVEENRGNETVAEDGQFFSCNLVNPGNVYVFGGGHVSQQLVPLLDRCGFRCIVIEDRPEFTAPELFENRAAEIRLIDMSRIEDMVPEITAADYICVMTRGHKDDYLVQKNVLRSPAGYIGVIGSRHKIAEVNRKLAADGFSEEDISRIITPIGLDIGAETPAEIAVSVAAQMIERRTLKSKG